ncbi:hypothetical protein CBR_g31701 [Chara braunii]|uniref:peptidylprolyl isomerase n=1 Tax=Chara braunii TaxID=69332 RepID=A0A388JXY7_CHABU|nr:hypothetical protein CBR_g31701 [Chara braunii]|eukprot:GBG62684.1 hypothetical protein CBR_g31701 [Chara braunii]
MLQALLLQQMITFSNYSPSATLWNGCLLGWSAISVGPASGVHCAAILTPGSFLSSSSACPAICAGPARGVHRPVKRRPPVSFLWTGSHYSYNQALQPMDAGFVHMPYCQLTSEFVNAHTSKFVTSRLLTGNTLKVKFGRAVSCCQLQYLLGSNARGRQRKRRRRVAINCRSSSMMQAVIQGADMTSRGGVTTMQKLRLDGSVAERQVRKDGLSLHGSLATSCCGKLNMCDLDVDVNRRQFPLFSWLRPLRVLRSQVCGREAAGSQITHDRANQERCWTVLVNHQTTSCEVGTQPEDGGPEAAHPDNGHHHHLDDDKSRMPFYTQHLHKQQQQEQQLGTVIAFSQAGMDPVTAYVEETRNVAMSGNCRGQEVIAGICQGLQRRHAIASLIGVAMGLASSGTTSASQTARSEVPKVFTNIEEAKEAGEKRREEKDRELGPIVTLPSGVKYRERRKGTGEEITLGSICSVYYTIYKLNGYYVDSLGYGNEGKDDVGETFTFQYGAAKLAKGARLGMAGMKVGGKRRILVAPDLGWVDDNVQPPPTTFSALRRISNLRRQPLIFEVELLCKASQCMQRCRAEERSAMSWGEEGGGGGGARGDSEGKGGGGEQGEGTTQCSSRI